ncbi:MAG: hypothetical protein ACXVCD_14580, partial [Pseudobdellovibrionaceae bacterium]
MELKAPGLMFFKLNLVPLIFSTSKISSITWRELKILDSNNAALLWLYSLSCHACRHAVGGRINHFSKHPIRYR